jgi:hypothetical protein
LAGMSQSGERVCLSLSLESNPKLCGLQGYLPFTRSLLEL